MNKTKMKIHFSIDFFYSFGGVPPEVYFFSLCVNVNLSCTFPSRRDLFRLLTPVGKKHN